MNGKAIFAALFIAILATTAAFASPATATSTQQNEAAPQRQMAMTIPGSLLYDVNGTLMAWINASGHVIITTNIAGFHSYSINVNKLYIGAKISVAAHDINVSTSTGIVTATIAVNAMLVIDVNIDVNGTANVFYNKWNSSTSWDAKWLIPTGTTKNFSIPFPAIESVDPVTHTGSANPLTIKFTDANDTWTGTNYVVNHVQWDFSAWLRNRIQGALNSVWSKVSTALQDLNIPGIQGGFNVVKCVGKIDVWKTSGTSPDNILLMAGGFIDLVVDFAVVGHGGISGYSDALHMYVNIQYDINVFAELGLYLGLAVTSNWEVKTADSGGQWSLNTYEIQVPENATIVWKKVGVIVYYGSYAHQIDVTGGGAQGSTHFGGSTMFFVDYGWDGVPDFATNGTGEPDQLVDHTGAVTGTGGIRNVTLSKVSLGDWVYFKLAVPDGYTVKAVWKVDSGTRTPVNATQYWSATGVLYVCDDPAYTYTVELSPLTSPSGLPTMLLIVSALGAIIVVAGLMFMRKRSGSKAVSIK
ncbi:MAG: hypothetical protein WED04_06270 [Promethearchaeati archaeon SRVP18_Atabeyarchaeia-1]